MARDPLEVPPLRVLLRETEQGMRKPATAYQGWEFEESNETIQRVMQELTLNA